MSNNPEIGTQLTTRSFNTNCHIAGSGDNVLLIHGSGPGVSAWANWRLVIPYLASHFRVVAPDLAGFGYSDGPADQRYSMALWVQHAIDIMDELEMDRTHLVGNSLGGALALALATQHPDRVERLVLMGSAGVTFPLTQALDAVWGYQASPENMRRIMDTFAFDRSLVTDELAELRYRASARPGVQEAYASMFPAPRQRWVDALVTPEEQIRQLECEALIVHGRDDAVIPQATSLKLHELIDRSQLHVFGRCGHWTQIEHSERFNHLVRSFLSE